MVAQLLQNINIDSIKLGNVFRTRTNRDYISLKNPLEMQIEDKVKYPVRDFNGNKRFKMVLDVEKTKLTNLFDKINTSLPDNVLCYDFTNKLSVNVYTEDYNEIEADTLVRAEISLKGGYLVKNVYYPKFVLEKCEVL